jgi:hypothetical protein
MARSRSARGRIGIPGGGARGVSVLPLEASTEGGGVWQDNLDGTFTQLRDGYFVPASGYSYLDLYLMGLITAAEVPDFFIVRPLVRIGTEANGRPIFKGQRMRITIQDVIAAVGNYGEIYDRNFGSASGLKIKRGMNRLWKQGGLLYAPPFQ